MRTTVLTTHLDTVGARTDEWTVTRPWSPLVQRGRLFGLGASDAKGVAASMLAAAARFHTTRLSQRGRVMVALVADEERSGAGTAAAVPFARRHRQLHLDPRRTSVIVGEPTGLGRICLGNRGNAFCRITVTGKSAHGSRPTEGRNAAEKAARIIARLPAFARRLQQRSPDHLFGAPTITVTSIAGNLGVIDAAVAPLSLNTIPGEASFVLDCRVGAAYFWNNFLRFEQELRAFLRTEDEKGFRISMTYAATPVQGHAIPRSHPVVRLLASIVRDHLHKPATFITTPGANDASFWGLAGFPTINEYGPGTPSVIHTGNEWAPVADLERATSMFQDFAERWIEH